MALYFVDYDLDAPGKDYQSLYKALEALGAKRILDSMWGLRHNNTNCELLRDHLRQSMDGNDRIIITKVETWASWNAMSDINKI